MSIRESALSLINSISQSDYLRAVTSGGDSRRVTMANAAKAVVEGYSGSSLGGSQRTVKAAIDAMANDVDIITKIAIKNTASGPVASFPDGSDGLPFQSLIADINPVQSGSGTPSPQNIRPISGHTQVKTTRAGKNLLRDSDTMTGWWKTASTTLADGVFTLSGNSDFSSACGTHKLSKQLLDGSTKYVLSFDYTCTDSCLFTTTIAGSSASVDSSSWPRTRYTGWVSAFTLPSTDGQWTRYSYTARTIDLSQFTSGSGDVNSWFIQLYARSNVTLKIRNIQIEVAGEATPYEVSNVNTYTTPLGRTVYGGTLDVVSGLLTVTHKSLKVSDISWTYNSPNVRFLSSLQSDLKTPASNTDVVNAISSAYNAVKIDGISSAPTGSFGLSSDGYISVRDDDFTVTNDFISARGNETFVFELATPQTYQLTAQQIQTLLGQNNVWADSGDVDVVYIADTKLYIDNH